MASTLPPSETTVVGGRAVPGEVDDESTLDDRVPLEPGKEVIEADETRARVVAAESVGVDA